MAFLLAQIVVIVILCAFAVWALRQIAPNHPAIVDGIIWVLCVGSILLLVLNAFGLLNIPLQRLR